MLGAALARGAVCDSLFSVGISKSRVVVTEFSCALLFCFLLLVCVAILFLFFFAPLLSRIVSFLLSLHLRALPPTDDHPRAISPAPSYLTLFINEVQRDMHV